MKLVFLHGPPASGKYTIARGLAESAGTRNFHNHLTLEVAKSLFEFGTKEFWALTHELRRVSLRAKASDPHACVIFTNCYSSPHDDAMVKSLEEIVTSQGGEFLPVYLQCSLEELRRRVVAPSRVSMRKLLAVEGLEEFLGRWNCVALDRPNSLSVSTSGRSAEECVHEIAGLLGLQSGGTAS